MSVIDQIVDVEISLQSQAVPKVGFGIPLILGPTGFANADIIRYYSSTTAMLADGFTTSDAEYVKALSLMSQALKPSQFGIGKRTTPVAQVDTVSFTAVNLHVYKIKISGTEYSYTADASATLAEIVAGLSALITADAAALVVPSGSTTLILTAVTPGGFFITDNEADTNITVAHTTASNGVANDIAAIQEVANGDAWYGLILTSSAKADILQAAAYIETQKKIYIACSSDGDVITNVATDVMSLLKGFDYDRTGLAYTKSGPNAALGPDAAWVGGQLPQTPGASTWKFKQLKGVQPDLYSETQRNFLVGDPPAGVVGKNANIYETVGGVNITEEGWAASGQFIDVTVGLDWLHAEIQTNVYALLVSNPKIPYTDLGGSIVQMAIIQAIKQGVANGLIDGQSPYSVTVPPVLSENANNRAIRFLPDVTFECRFAGAFHFIKISGTVTT